MARQLALCRRLSTHLNYQSKWNTYCAWCHSRGHSVSRPSGPKVADFLLHLRCSLHLSYSSIVSYCSILSAAFCFVLLELSSHPILHDLLRSFRIERPLPSSWFPPWDLLKVLSLLQGPPFEPLSSCSLQDLTRKVLFLLSCYSPPCRRASRCLFLLSPLLVAISFWLTIRSLGPSLSLLLILCLDPYGLLWVLCLGSCYFVRSVHCNFTLIVLLCCLSSAVLFVSPRPLSKNALSFFVVSSFSPFLLLPLLLLRFSGP